MAKLRGPLLSFRAKGQIGKALVMSSWKGIPYARQFTEPAYTNTTEQQSTRDVFRFLNALYARFGSVGLLPWDLGTVGRPLTPRNAFIKANLAALRTPVTLGDMLISAGARGGPAAAAFTAAPGGAAGEIDVEIVAADPPTGWLVASAGFFLLLDQDPHDALAAQPQEITIPDPGPFEHTFVGLTSAADYYAAGYLVYTRPDGSQAVSVSAQAVVAAT